MTAHSPSCTSTHDPFAEVLAWLWCHLLVKPSLTSQGCLDAPLRCCSSILDSLLTHKISHWSVPSCFLLCQPPALWPPKLFEDRLYQLFTQQRVDAHSQHDERQIDETHPGNSHTRVKISFNSISNGALKKIRKRWIQAISSAGVLVNFS